MKVEPIKPASGYIGGKSQLARKICPIIDKLPHSTYVEPFVGMGNVFFQRTNTPRAEVINDRSGDITNFFRIVQRHYSPLMDLLLYQISNRREFERLRKCPPDILTDLERAVRFLYLQRLSFGGHVTGRSFGVDLSRGGRFNPEKLTTILEKIHKRLSGVIIENLDWQDALKRYDRKDTLFYCDPPYYGTEHLYGKHLFDRTQYASMSNALYNLKGHFILSINDTPEIREAFSTFNIVEASVFYSNGRQGRKHNKELIVTNFPY